MPLRYDAEARVLVIRGAAAAARLVTGGHVRQGEVVAAELAGLAHLLAEVAAPRVVVVARPRFLHVGVRAVRRLRPHGTCPYGRGARRTHNRSITCAYKIRKPDGAPKRGAGRNEMRLVESCGDDKDQQAGNNEGVES